MSLYMDLNFNHDEYKIYAYTKSWFYDSLSAGRLEILTIKKGYHVKALLSLQVSEQYPYLMDVPLTQEYSSKYKTYQSLEYLFTLYLKTHGTVKIALVMMQTR